MKRTLKSFFVSALMVLVCLTLVACANDSDVVPTVTNLGEKYPEINGAYKINKDMIALKMYEAGVKNFNEVDFVATHQIGNITTKSILGEMTQKLDCLKIKQDNIYYLDSSTFTTKGTPNIKMSDQSIYENGAYRVRSAEKGDIKVQKGEMTVAKWPETEYFDSLENGLVKYPDDLTRINMYIVNSKTIASATKPVYDAKNKTYKFSLVLNINTATEDYLNVMEYKTKKGGITPKGIKFTKLKLTVVMWDNGLIKSIANEEAYKVNALGTTNKTSTIATTYFTYDRAEININNYLKFWFHKFV